MVDNNLEQIDLKLHKWLIEKGKQENQLYPEFYAGNSVDKSDFITLYLKKGEIFDKKELCEYLEIEQISLEEKKYSLNELNRFYRKIDPEDAMIYFIDEDSNCIVLIKEKFTEEDAKYFENKYGQVDWMALMDGILEEEVTIMPKQTASYQKTSGEIYGSTISFNAVNCDDANIKGFVSTTHGVSPVNMKIYNDGSLSNVIGEIATSGDIQYGAGIDALFAARPVGSLDVYTNQIYNTIITISGTERFRILHPTVQMYGATSGAQDGKIKTISAPFRGAGEYYLCTYLSAPGDSGGPVMHNTNVIGIHKAGGWVSNSCFSRCFRQPATIHIAHVCKYEKIKECLNVKLDLIP